MAAFHRLHFIPIHAPGAQPPEGPNLAPFAQRREKAKAVFLRQLVDHADDPFIGMEWNVPDVGRIVIQMDVVQHTAALVSIGRLGEASDKSGPSAPNTPCTLLMSAVLLSGFDDADGAALDLVAETPGFCDNPHLDVASYERARTLARPLMVQAFINQETFLNGHLRTLCDALADAFFTQFGATSEAADEEEGDEEGPDKQAA